MPEKNKENNVRTNISNPTEQLREYCKEIRNERVEELKEVLKKYFKVYFLKEHPRPWRAFKGKKRYRPVPVHRIISFTNMGYDLFYQWPNISKEILYEELKKLGFDVIVNPSGEILLGVYPIEKGKKLTFAQEWVKKINHEYSLYCANERKKAKELYPKCIKQLISAPKENVKVFEDYIMFYDFKFDIDVSPKCVKYLKKILKAEGIEEVYDENRNYKGIKFLNIEKLTKDL